MTEKNELPARKSCVCLPNLVSKYLLSQREEKKSLKRKLYHHGGSFMVFAKDYGFIHLRNSLFIHRKGWMFLQCSTRLQAVPRPVTNHVQAFGLETVSNDSFWLKGWLLQDFQECVQFSAVTFVTKCSCPYDSCWTDSQ